MTVKEITEELRKKREVVQKLRANMDKVMDRADDNQEKFLRESIGILAKCLNATEIPEMYRIAVVGQFKTGKSSFVNRLAGEKLAGVETNPETAAICIFQYDDEPHAEIRFVDKNQWARMQKVYDDNPEHPEAHRVKGLRSFNDEKIKNMAENAGDTISAASIDSDALIKEWITDEGRVLRVSCPDWSTKAGKKVFKAEIRRFTSAKEPLHYFVKEIVVKVPVPILRDNIEFVDTPGLNDTQLYRGQLTEGILKNVDVILLLTRSGASFSQFDKEFLMRQLRKKRLHHLKIIVTHVDNTFENALRDADEDDEEPPSFSQVKDKEEQRIRTEIKSTLDELLRETNLKAEDGHYIREKLDEIPIHFTSVKWFDENRHDDSGVPLVQEELLKAVAFQERVRLLIGRIDHDYNAVRDRVIDFFLERRQLIAKSYDSSVVADRIASVSADLDKLVASYEKEAKRLNNALKKSCSAQEELVDSFRAQMALTARNVLQHYETTDAAKHWRTRRAGYWGYFDDLGGRIADRVFPVMAKALKRYQDGFEEFLSGLKSITSRIGMEIQEIERASAIEDLPPIDLEQKVKEFGKNYIPEISSDIEREKDIIIERLEEFVSGELRDRLGGARISVTNIWGRGTTAGQTNDLREFYAAIADLLDESINHFAKSRISGFKKSLLKRASGAYPYLQASVLELIETRSSMLQERLKIKTEEERATAINEIDAFVEEVREVDKSYA